MQPNASIEVTPNELVPFGDNTNDEVPGHQDTMRTHDEEQGHPELVCTVCQDTMSPVEHSLLALECGHVYHSQCIERVWSVGGWPVGWCPSKCQSATVVPDDDDRDQIEAELNAAVESQPSQVEAVVQGTGGAPAGAEGSAPAVLL